MSPTGKGEEALVPEEHKEAVKQLISKSQVKNKVRRGGAIHNLVQEKINNQQLRYPEVRGLQFCPEKKKFVSRDKASAGAIARLAVMQLNGWTRPAARCPCQQRSLIMHKSQCRSETRVKSLC
uniref:Uncharacterized protein n=1 Tax=Polytomella parva TaxID=51329 RepID=A0A6U0YE61_9CHLO|mmetsp:Transcript_449/g.537  ORF Transcript_449/g.537 Transcript_449/m.537 type:complete len:123 (+) Transcript_449:211-579(+)